MAPLDKDTDAPAANSTRDIHANKFPYLKPHQSPAAYLRPLKKHKNMEPRARAGRYHGSLQFSNDLTQALYAFGATTHPDIADPHPDSHDYLARLPGAGRSAPYVGSAGVPATPYPETLRVLDEIFTDFLIEVSNEAVDHATYEGRHKVNPGDVKFVFRKDKTMLGRISQMERRGKGIKEAKKTVDMAADAGAGAIGALGFGMGAGGPGGGRGGGAGNNKISADHYNLIADWAGEERTGKGKGRGRGKRGRGKQSDMDDSGGNAQTNGEEVNADSPGGDLDMSDDLDDVGMTVRRSAKRPRTENT